MTEVIPAPPALNYKKLPDLIVTKEDLYNLIVVASRKFQQPAYAQRLAIKGMTHLDLANELFLKFLDGGLAPKHRRKGKGTKPANDVKLPIKKTLAYASLVRDLMNLVNRRTREEKARVQLVPETEVAQ